MGKTSIKASGHFLFDFLISLVIERMMDGREFESRREHIFT